MFAHRSRRAYSAGVTPEPFGYCGARKPALVEGSAFVRWLLRGPDPLTTIGDTRKRKASVHHPLPRRFLFAGGFCDDHHLLLPHRLRTVDTPRGAVTVCRYCSRPIPGLVNRAGVL